MKISGLIARCEEFKLKFGDIDVILAPQLDIEGTPLKAVIVVQDDKAHYLVLGDQTLLDASMQGAGVEV